jgi:hypothetical protein
MPCGKEADSLATLYSEGGDEWAVSIELLVKFFGGDWNYAEEVWLEFYRINHQRGFPKERAQSISIDDLLGQIERHHLGTVY